MSTKQLNRTRDEVNADLALARSALQPSAPATAIANTPANGITGTTVQAAINEIGTALGGVTAALDAINGEVI